MNERDKKRIKEVLLKKKQEIIDMLSEFSSESKKFDPEIAQDVGDKAESSYTKEFLLRLSDSERERLFLIDEALKRIEKNEYGSCQDCSKKISEKRLKAVPWTPHCIECQTRMEKESGD